MVHVEMLTWSGRLPHSFVALKVVSWDLLIQRRGDAEVGVVGRPLLLLPLRSKRFGTVFLDLPIAEPPHEEVPFGPVVDGLFRRG